MSIPKYSEHCLMGLHDYGYSDRCWCFCHRMAIRYEQDRNQ